MGSARGVARWRTAIDDVMAWTLTGAAIAYARARWFGRQAQRRGLTPELAVRFSAAERMQWNSYRQFCNDMCISAGTRARAAIGGKPASKIGAFLSRRPRRT